MRGQEAGASVIVFVMPGCPACHEYLPRFQAKAAPIAGHVPVYILDANHPETQTLADRFRVTATPTTVVARRGPGFLKMEGAIPDGEIDRLLRIALHNANGVVNG